MRSALVVVGITLAAARADADPAGDAQALATKGDFIAAAAKYREAFAATPRPELMCNVGVAYYKAKDLPRSARYLEQCVAIGISLDKAFIDNVKLVLATVQQKLAAGDFTPTDLLVQPTTATTSIDGGVPFDEPIVGSRRVWFPYGHYKLTFHAEGYVDKAVEFDAKDHQAIAQSVALERAPVVIDAGSGSAVAEPPPPGPREAPAPVSRPTLVPAVITSGVTLGLGVSGLVVYLKARSRANDAADPSISYDAWQTVESDTRTLQHTAWVLGALAGAGAAVSGYLWYRIATWERVDVQATGSGIAIRGRF